MNSIHEDPEFREVRLFRDTDLIHITHFHSSHEAANHLKFQSTRKGMS
jgi:Cft2 family RNA processing exonuclease